MAIHSVKTSFSGSTTSNNIIDGTTDGSIIIHDQNYLRISGHYGWYGYYQQYKDILLSPSFQSPSDLAIGTDFSNYVYVFDSYSNTIRVYSSIDGFVDYSELSTASPQEIDVICDSSNNLHVAWRSASYTIKYATYSLASGWSAISTVIDEISNNYNQLQPRITIDSSGNVWIAWKSYDNASSKYVIATANDTNWTTTKLNHTEDANYDCSKPAFAASADGELELFWQQKTTAYANSENILLEAYEGSWAGSNSYITTNDVSGTDNQNPFIGTRRQAGAPADIFHMCWEFTDATSAYIKWIAGNNITTLVGDTPNDLAGGVGETFTIYGMPKYWYATENTPCITYLDGTTLKINIPAGLYPEKKGTLGFADNTCNPFDTQNPTVAVAITVDGSLPAGGNTTTRLSVTFADANYIYNTTNIFATSLDNLAWTNTTGTANTNAPGIQECNTPTTLDGNDRLYYRCIHTDDFGHTVTSSNNVYVKPRPPSAPTVARHGVNPDTTINVTPIDNVIDAAAISPTEFEHKIYVSGTGLSNHYVQADGTIGASAVWQTVAIWSTIAVVGLTANTIYSFKSYTRNPNNTNTESDAGGTSQLSTSSVAPVVADVSCVRGAFEDVALDTISQIDSIVTHNSIYFACSYSAVDGGIWKSTNGTDWNKIRTGQYKELVSFGNYLYASYYDGSTNSVIYRSEDGSSWASMKTYVYTTYGNVVAFKEFSSYLYHGFDNQPEIYRTADGSTWTQSFDFGSVHSSIQNIKTFDSKIWAGVNREVTGNTLILREDISNTTPAATTIYTFCEFNNELYAFTTPLADIWKSSDGISWSLFDNSSITDSQILSSIVFNSKMYLGTYNDAQIWESSNGVLWTLKKSLSGETPSQTHLLAFTVFNNKLYAGTSPDAQIWESSDGSSWSLKKDLSNETPSQTSIQSFSVFNNKLYAGTSPDGQIWESSDGSSWTLKKDLSNESPSQTYIYSLKVLNNKLYAGTAVNGQIWESSDGSSWALIDDISDESPSQTHIYSLFVFDNQLFIGSYPDAQIWRFSYIGSKIYGSIDGDIWTFYSTFTNVEFISAMEESSISGSSKLYFGTNPSGVLYSTVDGSSSVEVKDFGAETIALDNVKCIYNYNYFDNILYVMVQDDANTKAYQIWRTLDGTTWVLIGEFKTGDITSLNCAHTISNVMMFGTTGNGIMKHILTNNKYTALYSVYDLDSSSVLITPEFYDTSDYNPMDTISGDSGNTTVTTTLRYKMITWDTNADYPNADITSKIKITALDSSGSTHNAESSNFTLDTLLPVFGSSDALTVSSKTHTTVTLAWTAAVTETNFSAYEIYYSTLSTADASNKNGTKWTTSDDATMGTKTTITTIITGLTANTNYYFALFAVDTSYNYNTTPLTVSATTYRSKTATGYTLDEYNKRIAGVIVGMYDKSTGALIGSLTTSDSNGYFSVVYSDTSADTYYLIGRKDHYSSTILDNIVGTITGETATERYNLTMKATGFYYGTRDVSIKIGESEGSTYIDLTFTKASIISTLTKNSISLTSTKSAITTTVRRPSKIIKTITMNYI